MEPGQPFPLFIFEVESKATNAMANNPLKVFAQDTKTFQKPLFFFQIVNARIGQSTRFSTLERQYGTYNYRIYPMGEASANSLIRDILEQHRRIRNTVDYIAVHRVLRDAWGEAVNRYEALRDAFNLELSQVSRLRSYLSLALTDRQMLQELEDALPAERDRHWGSVPTLPSYLGSTWGIPILCALKIGRSRDRDTAHQWNVELLRWQRSSSFMPMITPSFGLSRDYDAFLVGTAAPLVALCSSLAGKKGQFQEELCDVLVQIIRRLEGSPLSLHTCCWLANISARFRLANHFSIASQAICDLGGVARAHLDHPASSVSLESPRDEFYESGTRETCPALPDFLRRKKHPSRAVNIELVAVRALMDDAYIFEWSADLVSALWTDEGL
jgi:hypothetical protein